MFLSLCVLIASKRPRIHRARNDIIPTTCYKAVVTKTDGAKDRSGRYHLIHQQEVDVYEVKSHLYIIPVDSVRTAEFYASDFILYLDNDDEERPELPTHPVFLNNSRLNSNIRKWGNQFLCICYIAGISDPDEINSIYAKAVSFDWMTADCLIYNYAALCDYTKAKYIKNVHDHYKTESNEIRIAHCRTKDSLWIYYVVANRKGKVLYDPLGSTPIVAIRDEIILGY